MLFQYVGVQLEGMFYPTVDHEHILIFHRLVDTGKQTVEHKHKLGQHLVRCAVLRIARDRTILGSVHSMPHTI